MTKRTIALFICLALVAVLLVLNGTVFVVKEVNVVDYFGQDELDKQQIADNSRLVGNNIFTISENVAIDNIEKLMPEVKVVEIVRSFPSGVKIVVHKRLPVLAVEYGEDNFIILDRETRVLDVVDSLDEYDGITLVSSVVAVNPVAGLDLVCEQNAAIRLEQIIRAFEEIGEQGYRGENFCLVVEKITIKGEDVSIKTRAGVELRFNASFDYFAKLHSLVSYYDANESERNDGVLTVGQLLENGEYQILRSN